MKTMIAQGEYAVSTDPSVLYSAVLGSCVAVCVYDSGVGVGGMNHILLPGGTNAGGYDENRRFGAYLMELLLNGMYSLGARRNHMEFKVFGGSKIFDARFNPGDLNIRFVEGFLGNEGFKIEASSLGGTVGRRVEFSPVTGKVRMRFISDGKSLPEAVRAEPKRPPAPAHSGELDLF
jgi:chemotaxis protein CheD